jgi:hypothetical protein
MFLMILRLSLYLAVALKGRQTIEVTKISSFSLLFYFSFMGDSTMNLLIH